MGEGEMLPQNLYPPPLWPKTRICPLYTPPLGGQRSIFRLEPFFAEQRLLKKVCSHVWNKPPSSPFSFPFFRQESSKLREKRTRPWPFLLSYFPGFSSFFKIYGVSYAFFRRLLLLSLATSFSDSFDREERKKEL